MKRSGGQRAGQHGRALFAYLAAWIIVGAGVLAIVLLDKLEGVLR